MQKILFITLILFCAATTFSQEKKAIYSPTADAQKQLTDAIVMAKDQGKNILIQVGGNWCPWCLKFHAFVNSDPEIDSLINASYVYVLINYSKENKNEKILAKLGNPQRFGFPVLLILNEYGELLHTQDSSFLEEGKGYDKKKVLRFLKGWTPKALHE